MDLWFKLCLLLYLALEYLMVDAQLCNATVLRDLYPCGNTDKYKKFAGLPAFATLREYTLGRHFCYGWMNNLKEAWLGAKSNCMEDGGKLAELDTVEDWNELKRLRISNSEAWLGGKRLGGEWFWDQGEKRKISWTGRKLPWGKTLTKDSKSRCLSMRLSKWYDPQCSGKKEYVCQLIADDFYYTKPVLKTSSRKNEQALNFKSGDRVNITCTARSADGLTLQIQTSSLGTFTLRSESDDVLTEIFIENFQSRVTYQYDKRRCYASHILSFQILMSKRMDEAFFKCFHTNKESDSLSDSVKIRVTEGYRAPYLSTSLSRNNDGKYTDIVGTKSTITCNAMLGSSGKISFAVIQGEYAWGMSIDPNSKYERIGNGPPWVEDLDYQADSSYDKFDKSQTIVLRVNFVFSYRMSHASFGCLSYDITERGVSSMATNMGDTQSTWINVAYTSKRTITNLALDIDDATVLGCVAMNECNTVSVTCIGLGAAVSSISFQIWKGQTTLEWKPGSEFEMAVWAHVRDFKDFIDETYGPSVKIYITLVVEQEMADVQLLCKADLGGGKSTDAAKDLNLKITESKAAPLLKAYLHDNELLFLSLNCTARVGDGYRLSWEVQDQEGTINHILVSKDGRVDGVNFKWLRVEFIESVYTTACGQSIKSQLRVLNRESRRFGVTITCHAFDRKSVTAAAAKRLQQKLSTVYKLFGGGSERFEVAKTLTTFVTIWFSSLLTLTLGMVGCVCFFCRGEDSAERRAQALYGDFDEDEVRPKDRIETSYVRDDTDKEKPWTRASIKLDSSPGTLDSNYPDSLVSSHGTSKSARIQPNVNEASIASAPLPERRQKRHKSSRKQKGLTAL